MPTENEDLFNLIKEDQEIIHSVHENSLTPDELAAITASTRQAIIDEMDRCLLEGDNFVLISIQGDKMINLEGRYSQRDLVLFIMDLMAIADKMGEDNG